MGLVYVGSTVGVAFWASRHWRDRSLLENLLPAAIIAVLPTVIVWALLH